MADNRRSSKNMEEYWGNVARAYAIEEKKAEEDKKTFLFFYRLFLIFNCFLAVALILKWLLGVS
jgi:hypothetical protein